MSDLLQSAFGVSIIPKRAEPYPLRRDRTRLQLDKICIRARAVAVRNFRCFHASYVGEKRSGQCPPAVTDLFPYLPWYIFSFGADTCSEVNLMQYANLHALVYGSSSARRFFLALPGRNPDCDAGTRQQYPYRRRPASPGGIRRRGTANGRAGRMADARDRGNNYFRNREKLFFS